MYLYNKYTITYTIQLQYTINKDKILFKIKYVFALTHKILTDTVNIFHGNVLNQIVKNPNQLGALVEHLSECKMAAAATLDAGKYLTFDLNDYM